MYFVLHFLEIVTTFGLETILIYTALLLKKRIAVYYPQNQLEQLIQFRRCNILLYK